MSELVYVTPFLLAIALLIAMLAGGHGGGMPDEGFPLASVEHLAKLMRLRSVIVLGMIGALATYGLITEDLVIMFKFSSPVFAIAIVLALVRWIEAIRVLRVLRNAGVTADSWGYVVIVRNGSANRLLHANAWLMRRARNHAIPRASVDLQ